MSYMQGGHLTQGGRMSETQTSKKKVKLMRTGARNWSDAARVPKHQQAPRMSFPKARTPEESSSSWLHVTSDSCLEALLDSDWK